jgi:hypothetical protein
MNVGGRVVTQIVVVVIELNDKYDLLLIKVNNCDKMKGDKVDVDKVMIG